MTAMTAYLLTDDILGTGGYQFAGFDFLSQIDGRSNAFVTSRRLCFPETLRNNIQLPNVLQAGCELIWRVML
jgi:hypothetical protein